MPSAAMQSSLDEGQQYLDDNRFREFPRRWTQNDRRFRYWGPYSGQRQYPRATNNPHEPGGGTDVIEMVRGKGWAVDVSRFNFVEGGGTDIDKACRLLMLVMWLVWCGATKVVCVFDGQQRDPKVPKDDIRRYPGPGGLRRRGTSNFYVAVRWDCARVYSH